MGKALYSATQEKSNSHKVSNQEWGERWSMADAKHSPSQGTRLFLSLPNPVAPLNSRDTATARIAPAAVAVMGIVPAIPSTSAKGYAWAKGCKAIWFSRGKNAVPVLLNAIALA